MARRFIGWLSFVILGLIALSVLAQIVVPPTWHKVTVDTGQTQILRAWIDSCGRSTELQTARGEISGEFIYDCPTARVLINGVRAQHWCTIGYMANMQGPTEFRFKLANGNCDYVGDVKRDPRDAKKPYRLNL